MPASSAAHSRKSERMLQQKILIFRSFAQILLTFDIFAAFLATLSLKHQQQLVNIIDHYFKSKAFIPILSAQNIFLFTSSHLRHNFYGRFLDD